MWWNKNTRQDERLEQCLREDARRHRHEFSESLHRRICESIERTCTSSAPAADDPLPHPNRRPAWLPVALAASLLLALLAYWQANRIPPVAQVPVDPHLDLRMAEEVPPAIAPAPPSSSATTLADAGPMLARVDGTLTSLQWAYLDHDARLTWQLVTRMLPGPNVAESSPD